MKSIFFISLKVLLATAIACGIVWVINHFGSLAEAIIFIIIYHESGDLFQGIEKWIFKEENEDYENN